MAEKMEEPISHMRGWVNGRIAIVVGRYYSHMIRGARLPSTLLERYLDWESGSGIGLAQ